MFALKGISRLIFGSNNQESMIELPQGQLYLVRPFSPKGYSELLFKDASARIRRTAQEFQYQLVVQRVYEEGEAELLAEEEGDDTEADADILAAERDEKTFLLDEALHFRVENREGSERVLCWRDLSGDAGDVFEFVCDGAILPAQVKQFELIAKQCQYERKYRKPHATASSEDLLQFEFDEQPIPPASPIHSPVLTRSIESSEMFSPKASAKSGAKRHVIADFDATPTKKSHPTPVKTPATKGKERDMGPPAVAAHPESREMLAAEVAELHFFDFPSGTFAQQDASVTATVTEIGNWKYWLQVGSADRDWLGIPVTADINPVFNFEFLSFIFNQFADDGSAYSWLLRFKDHATLERFQQGLLQALWEQLNQMKWSKIKDKDRDYVADAFNDLAMEDAEQEEEEEEEHYEDADEGSEEEDDDSDEDEDDVDYKPKDGDVNKQIAVGYKHDRSFVVRGSKIGVFKHTPNNNLEFSTNISKVQTSDGKLFSPKKVMLHNEDRNLILQKDDDPNKLFRMDLEYGKVVDEWNVHEDIPVVTFAPENKFAQMTHEPTFLGISKNALYRIDPRLSGTKLVDSELKQYASKNDFSAISTTEKGHIAVASNKGDIRLFDRLGINAKTHIPALGEPIIGLDVSADGRWVLGTCRTYLLLIDAQQKSGKNEGKLGFEKSFAADQKPQPRRLALTPEHVAQFAYETGKGVNFTPAKFNTGEGVEESSIITATGPYIIEWNLKKVLTGKKSPYLIKRYSDDVKADDFKFGTDKNVIVALPHEVNMVSHTRLKRPTRESIAGDFGGRRGSRGPSKLSRSAIVEEAF
ncbi:VID27 cytoplasmic protein-domain-containing protein [Triangularia verruculosa]|uniref:VID27 cytoplasmic protein-domain-containing protein n=1 Tax=Triangularia verruculosa TaxID=2587418 RepID=A0AAN7AQV8_9PEZI|nr:VID27 cytoplasmic protein-domain-containing protein [Triangularia verruculosa]